MQVNTRDIVAGMIFVVLGGLFALGSLRLEIGTPFRMGPGYFPLVLAIIMMGLGAATVFQAFFEAPRRVPDVAWRGLVFVVAAPIAFGLIVRGLGLLPAVAVVTFFSAFASRRATPLRAILLTTILTVSCVLIFHYGLGLPIPLFGAWLR
jgi:Tripartite tricarboxylate transporter TctB family